MRSDNLMGSDDLNKLSEAKTQEGTTGHRIEEPDSLKRRFEKKTSFNVGLEEGSRLAINVAATKTEKFFVKGLPFTQLSDHFGISTQLEVI